MESKQAYAICLAIKNLIAAMECMTENQDRLNGGYALAYPGSAFTELTEEIEKAMKDAFGGGIR